MVRTAQNMPPHVNMALINTTVHAVVFRIKAGPKGIVIRKQVQNATKTALTDIRSVVGSQTQSIETMYVDIFPQRKKHPDTLC